MRVQSRRQPHIYRANRKLNSDLRFRKFSNLTQNMYVAFLPPPNGQIHLYRRISGFAQYWFTHIYRCDAMVNLLIAKYTSKRPCIGKCEFYRWLKPTIRSTLNLLLFIRFCHVLQYCMTEGWPSGLRHWLQEPASYDTGGSNPSPFSTVRDANWKA